MQTMGRWGFIICGCRQHGGKHISQLLVFCIYSCIEISSNDVFWYGVNVVCSTDRCTTNELQQLIVAAAPSLSAVCVVLVDGVFIMASVS